MGQLHAALHVIYSRYFVTLPQPTARGDMSKQIFIVTGSNTGLGYELCLHLLRLGVGRVILTARNPNKGEAARQALMKATSRSGTAVEVWSLDMDSYDSVKAFAGRVNALPRIDGICANAGLATTRFSLSEGIEKTMNVNIIGVFLLFFLLLPKMRDHEVTTGTRTVFSIPNSALYETAHHKELDPPQAILRRLNDPEKADMAIRYPLSKLLVLWLVRELASEGADLPIVNTPNPSFCASSLMQEQDGVGVRIFTKLLARTGEEGSRTLYHGLMSGSESHGQYLTNCHVEE